MDYDDQNQDERCPVPTCRSTRLRYRLGWDPVWGYADIYEEITCLDCGHVWQQRDGGEAVGVAA